jgi:hypothetical protein
MLTYPIIPKSAYSLLPGQFWALPLSDGSFGCGRIIQIPPNLQFSRMHFLAGLLDWHSFAPPTSESIAGAVCLAQGSAHIKAIIETGGSILGFRNLETDGIEPWTFRGAQFWKNSQVHYGLIPMRPQTPEDENLPLLSTWGYNVIRVIAENRFIKSSDAVAARKPEVE